MSIFKTLVFLNRSLIQGLQRPLMHFSLCIPFVPSGTFVRVWSQDSHRWVWNQDDDYGVTSTVWECPDEVIEAHVLPLLCISLNPAGARWAAFSFLADPPGVNCHVHMDADVVHSLRNTVMRACREAHGNMMFSVARPPDCKTNTVALQQGSAF